MNHRHRSSGCGRASTLPVHPLPVKLPVPFERLGPAPDRIPALLGHRHGPVGEGNCRALFQQPGVILPPAVVAFDHPVDAQEDPPVSRCRS